MARRDLPILHADVDAVDCSLARLVPRLSGPAVNAIGGDTFGPFGFQLKHDAWFWLGPHKIERCGRKTARGGTDDQTRRRGGQRTAIEAAEEVEFKTARPISLKGLSVAAWSGVLSISSSLPDLLRLTQHTSPFPT